MTIKARVKSLRSFPILKEMKAADVEKLAKIVGEESYPAGHMLFDTDSVADKVYLIDKGKVKVSRTTRHGDETTIIVLGHGDVIGELAALDGRYRSARVTFAEDTSVFSISRSIFAKLLKKDRAVSLNLLRVMASRIRNANDIIVRSLDKQRTVIESRVENLHRLIEASRIINSTLDLDKLLGLILDAAAKSIEADRGTLYLVDMIKQELWSKVLQGTNMVEIRLPVGKGIAGYVAQTGETINIADAYKDSRFNPDIDKRTGYRTRNMLCMPMRNKDGKIIGVFQLLNKKDGAFGQEDEQFIDAFSAHASIAIENARMAQEMVQSERLSAVGRMASVIIHDIKNPMGTLRVYAQVMKKKSGNEEAGKLADEMIRQVDRFVNMTQEILDFTKGVSASNFAEAEFSEVMESVLTFIENDLTKNNIQLVKNTLFKGKVMLDQDKMVRVFYNIASNARDAMPNGGSLTVSTIEENGFVRIDFTDTGSGMPEEVKKRIFEPFMTYGKKHGTGLGMAIVKKVIDDHKGRIEIDSEMGKGTTIKIFLPML